MISKETRDWLADVWAACVVGGTVIFGVAGAVAALMALVWVISAMGRVIG